MSGGILNTSNSTQVFEATLEEGLLTQDTWLTNLSVGDDVTVVLYNKSNQFFPEFQGRFFAKINKNQTFIDNVEVPFAQNTPNVIVDQSRNVLTQNTNLEGVTQVMAWTDLYYASSTPAVTFKVPTPGDADWTITVVDITPNPSDKIKMLRSIQPGVNIRFYDINNNFSRVYTVLSSQIPASGNLFSASYTRAFPGGGFAGGFYAAIVMTSTYDDTIVPNGIQIVSDRVAPDTDVLSSTNPAVFETEPNDIADADIYYEVGKALPIADAGNVNTLDWFNCYSFGNGVESDRIRDDFNALQIGNGVRVSSTLNEPYEEERRASSMIFSGIFNSISGINNTNQFLIAENITKDLNPTYGSIQKLHARDTDLIALLEDKCFRILADKDALYNADGSTNVTSSNNVLGQTVPFVGEYGISKNPESFASFGFRSYFTDKARGTVLRLSRDGLTDIGDKGMSYFFQDAFKTNVEPAIIGAYDADIGSYNVVLGSQGISFKEQVDGWNTKMSYDPEFGISLNNEYYTFKDGSLWEHSNPIRSNFYGVQYESTVTPIFNDAPTSIKNFKTLSYEGTTGWTATIETKKQVGTQGNPVASDPLYVPGITGTVSTWKEREGIYFNYIMGDGTTLTNFDAQDFSVQGIGNVLRHDAPYTVIEINGEINISLQPGDVIYSNNPNNALRVIGTVLSVNRVANFITLTAASSVTHPVTGDFMLFAKDSQVNTSGLLGYYAEVKLTNSSTFKEELFAVNSEIFISSE